MSFKIQFLKNHFDNILSLPFSFSNTLSELVNQYYKENKQLGSKDRKVLSELVFTYFRYKNIINLDDKIVESNNFEFFFIISYEVLNKSDTFHYILAEWEKYWVKYDEFEKYYIYKLLISMTFENIIFSKINKSYNFENKLDIKRLFTKSPTTIRPAYSHDNINNLKYTLKNNDIGFYENSNLSSLDIYSFSNINSLMESNGIKIEIQDNASLIVSKYISELSQINKFDYILDACAGSGGKSLAVKFYGCNSKIDLFDNNLNRLYEFNNRNNNFNDLNLITAKNDLKKYDLIFIDAPCTGSGTFRRHPDKLHTIDKNIIDNYVKMQKDVLDTYSKYLKENGILIYITCSFFNEENIDVISSFIKDNPLFNPEPITNHLITDNSIKITNFAYQLIPNNYNGDIFFISQLKMKESK